MINSKNETSRFSLILKKINTINHLPIFLFISTLFVYVNNLSPAVYGGDSGDLIVASLTHGVAHPSGYPLQTMLGILFLKIPILATPAWKIGLVSAIFSSITIAVFYKAIFKLTKNPILSFLTSLILAFTYTFWQYAEVVEVFALNSFFIATLIYLTVNYVLDKKTKTLYLMALIIGLSLTNNLSIVLLFPPIVTVVLLAGRQRLFKIKTIITVILLFILGLTPYLYILLAAKGYPIMNWGYAVNFQNFLDLVSRKYYGWGVSVATSRFTVENITYRLSTYFDYWLTYINNVIPALIILGAVQLIRTKKYLIGFFFASSFVLMGPLYVIYGGTSFKSFLSLATLEKFFISNLITSFMFIPFGILFLQEILGKLPLRKVLVRLFSFSSVLILALVACISFTVNFPRLNFKDVYIGDDLAKDLLSNLPEKSVLLLRNDNLAFNAIYYQQAFNFRKDIEIPGLYNGFETNLVALGMTQNEVVDFKTKNKGVIDKETLEASIGKLLETRNVFIDGAYNINGLKYGKIIAIPQGLLYKFEYAKNLPYPEKYYLQELNRETAQYQANQLSKNDKILLFSFILGDVQKLYSVAYFNIAMYLKTQYNDEKLGLSYLIKCIELDPFTPKTN